MALLQRRRRRPPTPVAATNGTAKHGVGAGEGITEEQWDGPGDGSSSRSEGGCESSDGLRGGFI